jgi:hypothetical protein
VIIRRVSSANEFDGLVKSCHSGERRIGSGAGSGVQGIYKTFKILDSGFRRNDGKTKFQTFYGIIKLDVLNYLRSFQPGEGGVFLPALLPKNQHLRVLREVPGPMETSARG